jgi:hypothetical protein
MVKRFALKVCRVEEGVDEREDVQMVGGEVAGGEVERGEVERGEERGRE